MKIDDTHQPCYKLVKLFTLTRVDRSGVFGGHGHVLRRHVSRTDKNVQQDRQQEPAHQSIKREAVEDYGAEGSNAPSAMAGGEVYAHAAPAEASAPAANVAEAYASAAPAAEAQAPSAAERYTPVEYEVYAPYGEVINV